MSFDHEQLSILRKTPVLKN